MNITRILKVLEDNYVPIPLEAFGRNAYKTLISTVLSSRTKDEVTYQSSKRLFKLAPNPYKLSTLSTETIAKTIYPVGFYNQKAKYLTDLSRIIIDKHRGKIPSTTEDLIKLPGVGRKTANLVLNRAFQIPAIAVDTHVHRISNILGLVKTENPTQTEKELGKVIPKIHWHKINRLFVSAGRQYRSKKSLISFLKMNKLI